MENRSDNELINSNSTNSGKMKFLVLIQLVLSIVPIFCLKQTRIVIVGSGAAGISAASELMKNGFNNVTILEAQNRIGGRIWTKKIGKYLVDLGAQLVHGDISNIIYDLASPLGLLQKGTEYGLKTARIYGSSGVDISEENFMKISSYDWASLRTISDNEISKIKSIGEYMTIKFNEFIKTIPDIPVGQREEIRFLLNRARMSMDGADDWNDVSFKSLLEYQGFSGDYLINWKDKGFSTLLDILMKKIPNPEEELPVVRNTIFNSKVTKINYGGRFRPVKVSTADGREYFAEHVIFTGSLGVLKACYKKLFKPSLPEKKINAIEHLGFGVNSLIFLIYDEPWWAPESNFVKGMLWNQIDRVRLNTDPERNWMLGVYMAITIEHKPNLLCLRMSGNYSRAMEKVPQGIFKNQTVELIRKFFGRDYNVTDPKRIKRTTWNTNGNIRGSYSFRSVESDKFNAKNEDLAEPVKHGYIPKVLFAGEATDQLRYATVQGAVMSGIREADRLIRLYEPVRPDLDYEV